MCFAYSTNAGGMMLLWLIQSGVLQGCPLSGLLFVVAIDPFSRAFEKLQTSQSLKQLIDPHSLSKHNVLVRLCCDDVGAALSSIVALHKFEFIFRKARVLACLTLKASKCVLVPLFHGDFEKIAWQVKEWLSKFIPEWKHFKIAPAAV